MNDFQYGAQTPDHDPWDSGVKNDQIHVCNSAYTIPRCNLGEGTQLCPIPAHFVITALVVITPTAHAVYITVIAVYMNFTSVCGTSSSPISHIGPILKNLIKKHFFLYLCFFIGFGTILQVGSNVLYH